MKKTYSLVVEGKNKDRLLDASKHDIRKYLKRERAKALPTGADFWDFSCKSGPTDALAQPVHSASLFTSIDALVNAGETQFYVEIVAKPGHRTVRSVSDTTAEGSDTGADHDS